MQQHIEAFRSLTRPGMYVLVNLSGDWRTAAVIGYGVVDDFGNIVQVSGPQERQS